MSIWECPYCPTTIQRNPDDPVSEAWAQERIAACERTHTEQLREDHHGDEDALRLHLRNPALAHAIAQVTSQGLAEVAQP